MKNARIYLSIIFIIGIISLVLAVKAKNNMSDNRIYCADPNRELKCNMLVTTLAIDPFSPIKSHCTQPLALTTTCPLIGVTTVF